MPDAANTANTEGTASTEVKGIISRDVDSAIPTKTRTYTRKVLLPNPKLKYCAIPIILAIVCLVKQAALSALVISAAGSVALGAIYVLGGVAALYLIYKVYKHYSAKPLFPDNGSNDATMVSQIMNDSSRENNPHKFGDVHPDKLVDLRNDLLDKKYGNQIIVEYYDTKRLQTSVFVVKGDALNLKSQLVSVFKSVECVQGEFAVHMNCLANDTENKGLSDTIRQCIRGSIDEGNISSQQWEQSGDDLSIEFFGSLKVDINEKNGYSKDSVICSTENGVEFISLSKKGREGENDVTTYLVKHPYSRRRFRYPKIPNSDQVHERKTPTGNSKGKALRFRGRGSLDGDIAKYKVGYNGARKLLYPHSGSERYFQIRNNNNESDGHKRANLFKEIVSRRPEVKGVFEASEPTISTLMDGSLFYERSVSNDPDPYGEDPDLLHIGDPVQWEKPVGVDGKVEYKQGKVLDFVYYHTTATGPPGWRKETLGQDISLSDPPKEGMDQGCVYYNVAEKGEDPIYKKGTDLISIDYLPSEDDLRKTPKRSYDVPSRNPSLKLAANLPSEDVYFGKEGSSELKVGDFVEFFSLFIKKADRRGRLMKDAKGRQILSAKSSYDYNTLSFPKGKIIRRELLDAGNGYCRDVFIIQDEMANDESVRLYVPLEDCIGVNSSRETDGSVPADATSTAAGDGVGAETEAEA